MTWRRVVALSCLFGLTAAVAASLTTALLDWGGSPRTPAKAATSPVVAAAGDIAESGGHQAQTAALLGTATRVVTLGDNAYPDGTLSQFQTYYQPSWGAKKSITKPSPGNHDYHTSGAAGYRSYFSDTGVLYGTWTLPGWRFLQLDSNVSMASGSAQYNWVKSTLASNTARCVAAYWHHPRFSSGPHGNNTKSGPIWTLLYNARADVILNGHDHDYERFNLQTPSAAASTSGIREFVVGTGGADLYAFSTTRPNSAVRRAGVYGVLRLTVNPTSYSWAYVTTTGATVDSGSTTCH